MNIHNLLVNPIAKYTLEEMEAIERMIRLGPEMLGLPPSRQWALPGETIGLIKENGDNPQALQATIDGLSELSAWQIYLSTKAMLNILQTAFDWNLQRDTLQARLIEQVAINKELAERIETIMAQSADLPSLKQAEGDRIADHLNIIRDILDRIQYAILKEAP